MLAGISLLLLPGIPLVLFTLLIPASHFARYAALVIAAYIVLAINLSFQDNDGSLGNTLGMYMILMPLGLNLLILIIRACLLSVSWQREPCLNESTLVHESIPVAIAYGIVVASIVLFITWKPFQSFTPAWEAYAIIIGITFVVSVIIFALQYSSPRQKFKRASFTLIASFILSIGILLAHYLLNSENVIHQAQQIAGSKPYCVQVADRQSIYVIPDTQIALSGLTMRAYERQPGIKGSYDALLLVGEGAKGKLYSWSHFKETFVAYGSKRQWPVIYCKPKEQFFSHLPLWFAEQNNSQSDETNFIAGGTEFVIPNIYQSSPHGFCPTCGTSSQWLAFKAQAPDFQPVNTESTTLSMWEKFNQEIQIYFKEDMRLPRSHEGTYNLQNLLHDENGNLIAKTECTPKICNQVFLHAGRTYLFGYPREFFDERSQLQQRLIEKVKSFEK